MGPAHPLELPRPWEHWATADRGEQTPPSMEKKTQRRITSHLKNQMPKFSQQPDIFIFSPVPLAHSQVDLLAYKQNKKTTATCCRSSDRFDSVVPRGSFESIPPQLLHLSHCRANFQHHRRPSHLEMRTAIGRSWYANRPSRFNTQFSSP